MRLTGYQMHSSVVETGRKLEVSFYEILLFFAFSVFCKLMNEEIERKCKMEKIEASVSMHMKPKRSTTHTTVSSK